MPYKFNPFTGTFDDSTPGPAGTVSAAGSGTAAAPGIAFASDPNTGIYNPGADQLAVATNGTGRLFINSTGSVGIGAALTYSSHFPNATVYNNQGVFFADGSLNYYRTGFGNNVLPSGPDSYINMKSRGWGLFSITDDVLSYSSGPTGTAGSGINGSERLRITSAGLVGIGTSSPNETLHVNGAIRFTSNSPVLAASDGGLVDWVASTGELRVTAARTGANSSKIGFITYNSGSLVQAATIDSAGRLGIGTTSPVYKLEVGGSLGNFGVAGNGCEIYFTRNANNNINANGAAATLDYQSGAGHIYRVGGTERARIDSSGRLLVGTSTSRGDGSPLQVVNDSANSIEVFRGATSAFGSAFLFNKSRGSTATPTIVSSGDGLGGVVFKGHDGTAYRDAAFIEGVVDGTPGASDMPGRLVFSTASDSASSPTERLRITSTGQMRLAGAGITFNGDTAAANELDDYEEGTWTPSLGGTATYLQQSGHYTKIGRLVNIRCNIQVNLIGTGSTFQISGLPFTSFSTGNPTAYAAVGYFQSLAVSPVEISAFVGASATTINMTGITAAAASTGSAFGVFGDSARIDLTATYFV